MGHYTLQLSKHHVGQQMLVDEATRFNVVACGRRFGKTVLALDRIAETVVRGFPAAYFAPTYKMLGEFWRESLETFQPLTEAVSQQDHRIELVTGGSIEMWSLEKPGRLRGRRYKTVCIDEAAVIPALQEAWTAIIRPTLTDYKGEAWFFSTPQGLNYFFTLFQRGQDESLPAWNSWRMPTVANPYIDPLEVEDARADLPELVFQQEYLAEFLSNEGAVFRNIDLCMQAPVCEPHSHRGHRIAAGIDYGQADDYTCVSVVCASCRVEIATMRINGLPWDIMLARVADFLKLWHVVRTVGERNSIGQQANERLSREFRVPNVEGFDTTASSKGPAVEQLMLAFDRQSFQWLPNPIWRGELLNYIAVKMRSGHIRYEAAEGGHDDTVIARVLSLMAASGLELALRPSAVVGGSRPDVTNYVPM